MVLCVHVSACNQRKNGKHLLTRNNKALRGKVLLAELLQLQYLIYIGKTLPRICNNPVSFITQIIVLSSVEFIHTHYTKILTYPAQRKLFIQLSKVGWQQLILSSQKQLHVTSNHVPAVFITAYSWHQPQNIGLSFHDVEWRDLKFLASISCT